jgi:hypothetical protein
MHYGGGYFTEECGPTGSDHVVLATGFFTDMATGTQYIQVSVG